MRIDSRLAVPCWLLASLFILDNGLAFAPPARNRHRWHSGSQDGLWVTAATERENNNNTNSNKETASSTTASNSSGGTFEYAFPRYKIDLPRMPQKKKKEGFFLTNLVKMPSVVQDIQSQALKQRLSSQYPTACSVEVALDLDGPHAMALLWKSAADMLDATTTNCGDSNSAGKDERSTVVALNDSRLVANFCHMLEWALVHVPDLINVPLQVEYLRQDNAVRLVYTRRSSTTTTTTTTNAIHARQRTAYDPLEIDQHTQAWVKRLLVKMGICPFTKSVKTSGQGLADVGVPMGKIAYHTSTTNNAIRLLADTWETMCDFLNAGPAAQSSILLAAPGYDDDFPAFAGPIFCLLETSVVVAQAEAALGVVCFHPLYKTPDGSQWPGFGHMPSVPRLLQWVKTEYNNNNNNNDKQSSAIPCPLTRQDVAAGGAWQRRTPHATINVLRADQLVKAESRRDSATLYPRNIRALMTVGNEKLQADLEQERNLPNAS